MSWWATGSSESECSGKPRVNLAPPLPHTPGDNKPCHEQPPFWCCTVGCNSPSSSHIQWKLPTHPWFAPFHQRPPCPAPVPCTTSSKMVKKMVGVLGQSLPPLPDMPTVHPPPHHLFHHTPSPQNGQGSHLHGSAGIRTPSLCPRQRRSRCKPVTR